MEVTPQPRPAQAHTAATWCLLSGLMVLRFPFLVGLAMYFPDHPAWISATFEVGTYLLTLALVLVNADRLADYHMDALSVVIILVFKPVETLFLLARRASTPLTFPSWLSLSVWASAVAAGVLLWRKRRALPRFHIRSFTWFLLGAGCGTATALLIGFPMSFQVAGAQTMSLSTTTAMLARNALTIPYQIGYAAVSEEPLFRGFLWGQLRRHGWRDLWVLLLQTALFMVGHVYYLGRMPMSFWVIVPSGALVLGLLAWRTRSLCTTLAAHGFMNAFGYPAGVIIASLRG